MTAAIGVTGPRRCGSGGAVRWAACFVLVLGLHAAAVLALLRRDPLLPIAPPPAEHAVLLELAPEAPPVAAGPPSETPPVLCRPARRAAGVPTARPGA